MATGAPCVSPRAPPKRGHARGSPDSVTGRCWSSSTGLEFRDSTLDAPARHDRSPAVESGHAPRRMRLRRVSQGEIARDFSCEVLRRRCCAPDARTNRRRLPGRARNHATAARSAHARPRAAVRARATSSGVAGERLRAGPHRRHRTRPATALAGPSARRAERERAAEPPLRVRWQPEGRGPEGGVDPACGARRCFSARLSTWLKFAQPGNGRHPSQAQIRLRETTGWPVGRRARILAARRRE
jgi:hypothetical protein